MVYNVVLNIVQQAEEAEDVAQEVFVQAFLSIGNFRGEAKLTTWLYRIALSKALEHNRKKKARKRWGFFRTMHLDEASETESYFDHPGVALDKKEAATILFRALRQLPEQQQAAFMMIKIQGMSYTEAAEILSTSVKGIEGLMHRAKSKLKSMLEEK